MMIDREMKTTINNWILQGKEAFLLTGARQIGKTYLIRECLKESKYDYVELNFIERPELVELFENATNAQDLLMRLSLITDKQLNKGKTIIFFDEIQEFKDIVTRIKFLVEEGSFRYIMSGSLLGVELNDLRSAPVGYLRIEDMYPLTVKEFMKAVGIKENILEMLEECYKKQQQVDEFVHKKMLDVFYLYLIVGGMPEAVAVYTETNDLARVAAVHQKIMRLYKADFTKYETTYKLKLREIYDSMPGQLDSKNKRFKINTLGKGLNYDRVANDFLWLKDAGVAIPVYNINEPKLPLIISENRNLFKLFFSDVGILTNQYSDKVKIEILNKNNQTISLNNYKDQVLLIVNTATDCEFTEQYDDLEELYEKYHNYGFCILDFPCNQFGEQAPGTMEEIMSFCADLYGVSFPQFAKIEVNGPNESPLYTYLKEKQDSTLSKRIDWNFTKFLVNQEGDVVARFEPLVKPREIENNIKKLLK